MIDCKLALMQAFLSATVPLAIAEIKRGAVSLDDALDEARATGLEIAHKGDHILYRDGKPGETCQLVERMAEAIAALAFLPGGVTAFGLHFEATGGGVWGTAREVGETC